ncbi:MAG TPA: glucose-6-phosphate isomerase [Mycobacteriales bacterium]|nr:glucose-6-phosphate isomerase [Mycobacteriales bacterium]
MSDAAAGGVRVEVTGELADLADAALNTLIADDVAGQLAGGNPALWGPEAEGEARRRLGWLQLAESSRPLLGPLAELRAALTDAGLDRVVLCGMGGSSLAPEVICAAAGVPLVTLDSTDPAQVAAALIELPRTVVVISSKSGGTLETDSQHRAFRAAFQAAGIDPAQRIVVVTDPGSPLEASATEAGVLAIFRADPNVGGRYSALTAFGLVPSALAGVAVEGLLDAAQQVYDTLGSPDGPALLLGAALGAGALAGRNKLVLADAGSGLANFGDWAEQLIAESTGKNGRGLLPVVVESAAAAGFAAAPDRQRVVLGSPGTGVPEPSGIGVSGPLGGQFLAWEFATAIAGRLLAIDPFDQPNVQESKDNTNRLLSDAGDGPLPAPVPAFTDGPIEVYAEPALLGGASTLAEAVAALLGAVPAGGYLAVMAYLNRAAEPTAAQLRQLLAARTPASVTFGWGPRFLHSTGQFHKGGPQIGGFLQVTAEPDQVLPIPGRNFDFGKLQSAQALGDVQALAGRGRPVLRVHLTDRAAGLAALLTAAGASGCS